MLAGVEGRQDLIGVKWPRGVDAHDVDVLASKKIVEVGGRALDLEFPGRRRQFLGVCVAQGYHPHGQILVARGVCLQQGEAVAQPGEAESKDAHVCSLQSGA